MESLDNILPRVIAGITPQPRVCAKHGVLTPIALGGRWAPRTCACDQEKRATEDHRQMLAELAAYRARRTYTWLGPEYQDLEHSEKTFDTFQRARQPTAFAQAMQFAANPRGNLVMYGEYGLGKTHLLAAIAQELNRRRVSCLFATAYKFFKAMQRRIAANEDYAPLVNAAKMALVLLIDDVDKVSPTEWKLDVWHDLMDDRANRLLPTAISTNKFHQLGSYLGDSVRSRLRVGAVEIEFLGDDFRKEL